MKKIIILLMLFNSLIISADTVQLDLENAVRIGLENNSSLQIIEINYNAAERSLESAWNEFLPSLNLSTGLTASGQIISEPVIETDPWTWNSSIGASLSLNTEVISDIKQKKLIYQSAQMNFNTQKNRLTWSIKKLFYYIITLKENIRLKEINLELARKRYVQTQSKFDNGLASRLELFSSRVTYENQKPGYTQAKLDYETALLDFKQLLGLESTLEIELVGTIDVVSYEFEPDDLINRFINEASELKLKLLEIEQLELSRSMAVRGNLTPTLSIFSEWGLNLNDPFNSESWKNDEWSDNLRFGFSFSLPLDGYIPRSKRNIAIQEVEDIIEKSRIEYEELRLNTINTIYQIVMELESYREKMELSELSMELAKETYLMAEESYNNGMSELLDVENAQKEMLSAEQNFITAQYQYLSVLIDLESTLDISLEDIQEEQHNEE
jgi:outer membrane protein TolC